MRTQHLWTRPFGLLALTLASALAAQAPADPPQLTVVGASLSKGMVLKAFLPDLDDAELARLRPGQPVADWELDVRTDGIGLGGLLRKLDPERSTDFRDYSDLWFFRDPEASGGRQLARAQRRGGLVLGIDLPFWFGFGAVRTWSRGTAEDRAVDQALLRLRKQEQLFALVEGFLRESPAALVLGDYPDVRDAHERVLRKSWVAREPVRAELNRRLRGFAKRHPRVRIYPLAERLDRVRAGSYEVVHSGETLHLGVSQLMQADQLHPTKFGAAVVVSDCCAWLHVEHPDLSRHLPADASFDRALDVLGVADQLAELTAK